MPPNQRASTDALFERLFSEYHRPILNYLYRLLGDLGQAEELAQDVFVKAYRSSEHLVEVANQRAWLYRVATNTAYDRLRRRKLVKWIPFLEGERMTTTDDHQDEVVARETVQQALSELPPKYRAPLVLYSVQGYSTREIAEMMGISEGAVKTRLFRARERFRQVYEGSI